MRMHENEIVILLSKLSDDGLYEFFNTIPIKFAQQYEQILKRELGIIFDKAHVEGNGARSMMAATCMGKLDRIKYIILADELAQIMPNKI